MLKRVNRVLKRNLLKSWRLLLAKRLNIRYVSPNFIYIPNLSVGSIVIDAGCSYEADFSLYMIKEYGLRAFGVDPTQKHKKALSLLEQRYKGHFIHLPFAITAKDAELEFYESKENESGSICQDHVNVKSDEITMYKVRGLSLQSILKEVNAKFVDMLKLDLEGAEYELLHHVERDSLEPFNQIFIEFHHHAIDRFHIMDTKNIVAKICSFGFKKFSLDDHNYLFYRA